MTERATITIDADAFAAAVRWAARAVPTKPRVPVLSGMMLGATGGFLTASAFDFTVQAGAVALADGDLPPVIVPGRMLADIAGRLAGKFQLSTDAEASSLTVRAGRDRFRLPVMPGHDYPSIPALPDPDGVAAGFADAVARATVAAATDDGRPALTGIQLTAQDGRLQIAASDKYRAAIEFVPWDGPDRGPVIVPAKRLKELTKEAGDKPSLGFGDSVLSVTAGNQTAGLGYLYGDFPQLMKLFEAQAAKSESSAQADRDQLIRAVSTSSLFANQSQPVQLNLTAGSITAWAEDDGAGELVIEAQYDGRERSLALQPAFLLDAFTTAPGPVIQLRLPPGPAGAVLIDSLPDYGADPDLNHRHIVMSLRNPQGA